MTAVAIVHVAGPPEEGVQACARCGALLVVAHPDEKDVFYDRGERVGYRYPAIDSFKTGALPTGSYVVPKARKPLVAGEAYCHEEIPLEEADGDG